MHTGLFEYILIKRAPGSKEFIAFFLSNIQIAVRSIVNSLEPGFQ